MDIVGGYARTDEACVAGSAAQSQLTSMGGLCCASRCGVRADTSFQRTLGAASLGGHRLQVRGLERLALLCSAGERAGTLFRGSGARRVGCEELLVGHLSMAEYQPRSRFAQAGAAKTIHGAASTYPFGAGTEPLARTQPRKQYDRLTGRQTRDCAPGDNPVRHHWITTSLPNYRRQRDVGLSPLYSVLPAEATTGRSKAGLLSGLPQESKTTALCNAGLSCSAPALATAMRCGSWRFKPRNERGIIANMNAKITRSEIICRRRWSSQTTE